MEAQDSARPRTLPARPGFRCLAPNTSTLNQFPLTARAMRSTTPFMGLDGVEIVMAVEDAFDIRIEDSEAEKVLTPGQLVDLVMNKVATTTTDVCLTHRSFNLLRRFFVSHRALSRKTVAPDTSLRIAFPREHRHAWLQQLSAELAIESPPELVRPDWLKASLFMLACLAGLAAAISFVHSGLPYSLLWLPALAVIAIGYIGEVATRRFRTKFPKDLATIGHLARWVMTHKPNLAGPNTTSWTRDQVAARVREIVVKTLACDPNYREDARFIQDLGLS